MVRVMSVVPSRNCAPESSSRNPRFQWHVRCRSGVVYDGSMFFSRKSVSAFSHVESCTEFVQFLSTLISVCCLWERPPPAISGTSYQCYSVALHGCGWRFPGHCGTAFKQGYRWALVRHPAGRGGRNKRYNSSFPCRAWCCRPVFLSSAIGVPMDGDAGFFQIGWKLFRYFLGLDEKVCFFVRWLSGSLLLRVAMYIVAAYVEVHAISSNADTNNTSASFFSSPGG